MGIGMRFPNTYMQLMNSIANGEYGPAWKALLNSQKYVAVNAEKDVYICRHCGHWETEYVLDLYVPKIPEHIHNKQYGVKTVAEWGYVPYVTSYDLAEDYVLLKHLVHKCPNCGRRTHKGKKTELQELSCPKCGKNNKINSYIHWD